jgi:hypothetical protein
VADGLAAHRDLSALAQMLPETGKSRKRRGRRLGRHARHEESGWQNRIPIIRVSSESHDETESRDMLRDVTAAAVTVGLSLGQRSSRHHARARQPYGVRQWKG